MFLPEAAAHFSNSLSRLLSPHPSHSMLITGLVERLSRREPQSRAVNWKVTEFDCIEEIHDATHANILSGYRLRLTDRRGHFYQAADTRSDKRQY